MLKIELTTADRWFNGWNSYGWFGSDDGAIIADLEAANLLPTEFEIGEVYPNPFNAMANLKIMLPEASPVTVKVYNVVGQSVATIVDGQLSAGYHTLTVDGSRLASGIYFVRADIQGQMNVTRKIMMVK